MNEQTPNEITKSWVLMKRTLSKINPQNDAKFAKRSKRPRVTPNMLKKMKGVRESQLKRLEEQYYDQTGKKIEDGDHLKILMRKYNWVRKLLK